jgi:hypothetical protein
MSETPEVDEALVDDQALAETKRDAAGVGTQPDDDYIRALLEERHGYEVYGRDDRVAQVDEQLALRGYGAAVAARAAAKPKTSRGRGSKPQQTA